MVLFLLFHFSFYLGPFSFLLDKSGKGLSILFIFPKNKLLVSLLFGIIFKDSVSFISALIFIISFLLLTLGFVCCSFSSSFKCKVRLFMSSWCFEGHREVAQSPCPQGTRCLPEATCHCQRSFPASTRQCLMVQSDCACSSSSQSMVPRSAASASPGNLLELRSMKSKTPGVGPVICALTSPLMILMHAQV